MCKLFAHMLYVHDRKQKLTTKVLFTPQTFEMGSALLSRCYPIKHWPQFKIKLTRHGYPVVYKNALPSICKQDERRI